MGTSNMEKYRYQAHTRTGYAYGTRNLHTKVCLFLHSYFVVVGAAKMYRLRKNNQNYFAFLLYLNSFS